MRAPPEKEEALVLTMSKNPTNIIEHKAKTVHDEFLKYAEEFKTSFPELQKLEIWQGSTFSLETAGLFDGIRELRILGQCNPSRNDLFSPVQLNNLQTLKLASCQNSVMKLQQMFKQFCEASKLKILEVDMTGANPLPVLSTFFSTNNTVRELSLANLCTETGLRFLENLKENTSIQDLNLHFARLEIQVLNRKTDFRF